MLSQDLLNILNDRFETAKPVVEKTAHDKIYDKANELAELDTCIQSKAMTLAHYIKGIENVSFSIALKKAWFAIKKVLKTVTTETVKTEYCEITDRAVNSFYDKRSRNFNYRSQVA